MSNPVLVTGATGAIGPTLIQHLLAEGYAVRALVRSAAHAAPLLPPQTTLIEGDITNPHAVSRAVAGAMAVCHLAAKLHLNNPTADLEAEYQRINVQGTQHIATAVQEHHIPHLLFFSTISVYGPSHGQPPFTEDSPLTPQTIYARTKAEAENLVRPLQTADGQPLTTILRLAAVYGPHMKGNYPRLWQAIQQRRFIPIGQGHNRRTLIHVADVATAVATLLRHPHTRGQTYNLTDGHIHPMHHIQQTMYHALGRTPHRFYIPLPLAYALAYAAEWAAYLPFFPQGLGRHTIAKLVEDVAVAGQKIQDQTPFRPAYTLAQGWATLGRN